MLYKRDVRERVRTAAPFLRFDSDPYPVLAEGRILWVTDAYTTTDRYPYSQSMTPSNLPDGSGLDTDLNYVRNSVKATVDAYDGTIRFYVIDDVDDPIIRAYQKAFPELFSAESDMPEGLREHWRYPEDMFRAQTEQFTQYHMTDTNDFYRKQFIWDIAPRPERGVAAAGPSTTAAGQDGGRNTTLAAGNTPIEPLYLTMQLPGSDEQEFVLTRPYVPRGKANQLSAFMAARMDGDNYGKLVSYEIPTSLVAPSPAQAATLIESDPDISATLSLIDQRGSTVVRGNVQLIPIGDAIVYARPIFVVGTGEGEFPRLRFVALAYGNSAVLVDFEGEGDFSNVDQGIRQLIATPGTGEDPDETGGGETPEGSTTTTSTTSTPTTAPGETTTTTPLPTDVAGLLAQADAAFAAADAAFEAGDLGEYQRQVQEAQRLVAEANRLLDRGRLTALAPGRPALFGRGRIVTIYVVFIPGAAAGPDP